MAQHIRPQCLVDLSFLFTDVGITDRKNAEICGVAVKTIRRWRRLYRRRGITRGSRNTTSRCPRCNGADLDHEAYAHLLGWYLGDGHIVAQKRGIYLLVIYNDKRYPGLNAEIADTLGRVKPNARVWTRDRPGCVATHLSWKHWPCLLPQHGDGMKHTRSIKLRPWQQQIVERHPGRFLRGLFHSDGCRITNWTAKDVAGERKRYEYPRYFFTNHSTDIIDLCTWALDLLGIAWRKPKAIRVSVAQQEAVAELDAHVGPKY